jgi:hypothetical protein
MKRDVNGKGLGRRSGVGSFANIFCIADCGDAKAVKRASHSQAV